MSDLEISPAKCTYCGMSYRQARPVILRYWKMAGGHPAPCVLCKDMVHAALADIAREDR